jgi:gliding motility-associated-like protein
MPRLQRHLQRLPQLQQGTNALNNSSDPVAVAVNIGATTPPTRLKTVDVSVNDPVQLQARTFGSSYLWSPAAGLSSATVSNPTVTTSQERSYTITITTPSGCQTVDSLLVRVFTKNVYVPNVFSPNGDGFNDLLYVNLVSMRQMQYFRIFNRYGKKVFETSDPTVGWNGRFNNNGDKQPVDTYVWTVQGFDKNGVPVNVQGSVSLLR